MPSFSTVAFFSPLPLRSRHPLQPPKRSFTLCSSHGYPKSHRTSPEKRPRPATLNFSRRSFLIAVAAAVNTPLLNVNADSLFNLETKPRKTHEEQEGELEWMHPLSQRFGFSEEPSPENSSSNPYTTATAEDYTRVTTVGSPDSISKMAKIYLARAGTTGFVAAFCAIAMSVSEREALRTKLPVVYDATVVNLYFSTRADKVLRRLILFAREIAGLSFELLTGRAVYAIDQRAQQTGALTLDRVASREDARQTKWAAHLRESITRLGPAVIKLGQAAATRQDIFHPAVVKQLQRLQDDVMPFFPTFRAFEVIQKELGASPFSIFETISPSPVAGASLGMVFKARVDGIDVAVKVQRPEVAEQMAMDCYIVRGLASVANFLLGSRTDFVLAVDEYSSRLFEELDYKNELNNMIKFQHIYGNTEGIYLPKAFKQFSSQRVLVTEWIDGVKLIDDDARVKPEDIRLVESGIRFALMQLLDKGYLHADMHNGNMLKTKSGYLAFIDFGLVSEVPLSVRESLVCALMHLIHGEYTRLAETFVGLAVMRSDDVEIELPLLTEALREAIEPSNLMLDDAAREVERLRRFTLVGIVGKLLTLGNRFPFVFNDYFLNNLRCLGMLEGLALNADPTFSILGVVYPYVVRRILTDTSPRFRSALGSVVIDSYGRLKWGRISQLLQDVQATAATTTFDFDKAWSMGFGKRGKGEGVVPLQHISDGTSMAPEASAVNGKVPQSEKSNPSSPSPDLILHFITSKSGRFLREYIINRFTSSMVTDWVAGIDKLFGVTASSVPVNAEGNGIPYGTNSTSTLKGLQSTEREISDKETRKRTRFFFKKAPFWQRWRVLFRLTPGAFYPLLRTLLHIAMHFVKRSAQAVAGKRLQTTSSADSASSFGDSSTTERSTDVKDRIWSTDEEVTDTSTWRPFNSEFLRRAQSTTPSNAASLEFTNTRSS